MQAHDEYSNKDKHASVTRRVFEGLAGGPLPVWHEVECATRVIHLEPGRYLFHAGDAQPYVYCIRAGLLKLVYDMPDGKEWIKAFFAEGAFFASANALWPGGRTTFSAVALENMTVERVDYRALQRLAAIHLPWQKLLADAFHLYGARKETRERELLTLSPAERYAIFMTEHPGLQGRVPQKDLARYLGVTPVGLSRIKGRLKAGRGA